MTKDKTEQDRTAEGGRDPGIFWGDDGAPRSGPFGDVYFDAQDGLAECRHVFLSGCGLPDAFAERDEAMVAELGFGLGLTIFALVRAWLDFGPTRPKLHVTSFEIAPPSQSELLRAASPWPELAPIAEAVVDAGWPRPSGFSDAVIDIENAQFSLTLAVGDARALLPKWGGQADFWFLDGFAPAKNPEMWDATLLKAVQERTSEGGRFATFTAAGWVRRALAQAGFDVEKRPGYGRKRDMTVGRLPITSKQAPDTGQTPASSVCRAPRSDVG